MALQSSVTNALDSCGIDASDTTGKQPCSCTFCATLNLTFGTIT